MECILEFLSYCPEELMLSTIIPKLRELLLPAPLPKMDVNADSNTDMLYQPTLVDMTASQLVLAIGKYLFCVIVISLL